ncbi:Phytanoyl-CoA dioxygenase (PhyH) [Paenibacillus konkukensis]|uniref:Ectoine hydroxylase n=1 Tax=Paenibacillus konkukensis TaxID=2020716 RepID=A0ABY4RQ63_9BACL|nr:ectoine hydroxylase [Paenibacillus konkukensis]UQZ83549.1 Phytanoyl-CoA dioxygenase (PhyH) [Paenibacillus konkukensis]
MKSTHPASEVQHATDLYPSRISDTPSITERRDPVVYSAWSPNCSITEEQSEFYRRNGYLFIESFFSPSEVQGLKEELKRMWAASRDSADGEVIREPDSDEVRSIFNVHRSSDVFKALSGHSRLKSITDYILGSETYIHQSRINFKPGFTGKEFYWHSDFETWHVEDGMPRMRALSCSIALEDNYHFNGPLMVVPGSQMDYVSCVGRTPDNHYEKSLRRQQYGVPDHDSLAELVQRYGIDTPVGKAGSIVLFDCNIMHGSNSNITPMPRSNVFIVYNSVENKLQPPYSGQPPRPEFIAARED